MSCLTAEADYLGAYLTQLLESSGAATNDLWYMVDGTKYLKIYFENVFIRELSALQKTIAKIIQAYNNCGEREQPLDQVSFTINFFLNNFSEEHGKLQLIQFLANLGFWQYFCPDAFVFARVLFDCEVDFWMFYCNVYKMC